MTVRKIFITAGKDGNFVAEADSGQDTVLLFAGETLEMICTCIAETATEEVQQPYPETGVLEAFLCRDSDGAMLAYTPPGRIVCRPDGRISLLIDTGNAVLPDAPADPFSTFTLHVLHYPAGSITGSEIIRVPVEFAPGCREVSHLQKPLQSFPEREEFFAALPDRSAPVLETLTDKGWQLNMAEQGTAWRWQLPGIGTTETVRMYIPEFSADAEGHLQERESLTSGMGDCSFLNIDNGCISFRCKGQWSRESTWQGAPGSACGETLYPVVFAPSRSVNGRLYCEDIHKQRLVSASVVPLPEKLLIDYTSDRKHSATLVVSDTEGNICAAGNIIFSAGCGRLEIPLDGNSDIPCQLVIETQQTDTNPVRLDFTGIFYVFAAGKTPLTDTSNILFRLGCAGRCINGHWLWSGNGLLPETTGQAAEDGFFTGTAPEARWGIETCIDLRDYGSEWSICGVFSTPQSLSGNASVLWRAGDPAGRGNSCIAALLLREDGNGGRILQFRCNSNGSIYTLEEKIARENKIITAAAVFNGRNGTLCMYINGGGSVTLPLPSHPRPALPAAVPGTAHPLLEAGYNIPDRAGISPAGCGIKTFLVMPHAITKGNFALLTKLMQ